MSVLNSLQFDVLKLDEFVQQLKQHQPSMFILTSALSKLHATASYPAYGGDSAPRLS